jgi:hypothetical protein
MRILGVFYGQTVPNVKLPACPHLLIAKYSRKDDDRNHKRNHNQTSNGE